MWKKLCFAWRSHAQTSPGYVFACMAVLAAGCAVAGWTAGRHEDRLLVTAAKNYTEIRGGGSFTNPLLECEPGLGSSPVSLKNLEQTIQNYIEDQKKLGNTTETAVYYRDLNNGPWIGIDEYTNFSPASLLKVPLMIAYFKAAETDPSVLQKTIPYDPAKDNSSTEQNYQPKDILVAGQAYSVEFLIEQMITESDNRAKNMLLGAIDPAILNSVYSDLEMTPPNGSESENFMNVKDYASFFRVLYNASYLNKNYSEKALSILAKTDFDNGLVKGSGDGTLVSHKMGERVTADGQNQLHDCGIVYYPAHPYLLCVMSRGSDFPKLEKTIADIAAMVYEETKNIGRQKQP